MFIAKVKSDGRLFISAVELPDYRDAQGLQPNKQYIGHVLDQMPTETQFALLSGAKWVQFGSTELEVIPGALKVQFYSKGSK